MVKKINLTDLFPDCKEVGKADTSKFVYLIPYGKDGKALELSLFHSEDEGDSEWHFNIFEVDKDREITGDIISYNANIL